MRTTSLGFSLALVLLISACATKEEPAAAAAWPPSSYALVYADRFAGELRERGYVVPAFEIDKAPGEDGFAHLRIDLGGDDARELDVLLAEGMGGYRMERVLSKASELYPRKSELTDVLIHCHVRADAAAQDELDDEPSGGAEPQVERLLVDMGEEESIGVSLLGGRPKQVGAQDPRDLVVAMRGDVVPLLGANGRRMLKVLGIADRKALEQLAATNWARTEDLAPLLRSCGIAEHPKATPGYWTPADLIPAEAGLLLAIRERYPLNQGGALVLVTPLSRTELRFDFVRVAR
jgi:hypothetical protein